jgi:hypothetical protein
VNDFIECNILKPLYIYKKVPCVRVNAKYIRQASKEMKLLKIKCLGNVHYITAQEVRNKWKPVSEVFLFPDRPMRMFQGFVVNNLPPEVPKAEEVNAENYLENMHKLSGIFKKILKKRGY